MMRPQPLAGVGMIDTETARVCFGERLAHGPDVRLAYLFGSRARGSERPNSDFDIAVLMADAAVRDAGGVNRSIRRLAARLADPVPAERISDTGLRTPETNRDTFSVLEEAGEISSDLAERLRGWASFRNVLVHQYANIDHRISYRAIRDDLNDLHEFRRWALAKVEGG